MRYELASMWCATFLIINSKRKLSTRTIDNFNQPCCFDHLNRNDKSIYEQDAQVPGCIAIKYFPFLKQ